MKKIIGMIKQHGKAVGKIVKDDKKGFTMVELLVVIAGFGLIFVLLVLPALQGFVKAETRLTLLSLDMTLAEYYGDKRNTPTTLSVLVPGFISSVPTDAWEQDFEFTRLSKTQYTLYSIGLDGIDDLGLGDDIKSKGSQ